MSALLKSQHKLTSELEELCAYIQRNLTDCTLCMFDLKMASGRTVRAIQYAFRKQLGCTPMQWVRKERLALARKRLKLASGRLTVTEIALACGFNNAANFARLYAEHYGELPSKTKRRRIN